MIDSFLRILCKITSIRSTHLQVDYRSCHKQNLASSKIMILFPLSGCLYRLLLTIQKLSMHSLLINSSVPWSSLHACGAAGALIYTTAWPSGLSAGRCVPWSPSTGGISALGRARPYPVAGQFDVTSTRRKEVSRWLLIKCHRLLTKVSHLEIFPYPTVTL